MQRWIITLAVALVSLPVAPEASAQYPERPITLIAPFPAGGAVDIVARGLAEAVKKHLPRPVVVVNRPGAAGTIGISEVVQAKPDGYTIGLGAVGILTVQPHLTALPYRTPDDYLAVMKLVPCRSPYLSAVTAPGRQRRSFWTMPGRARARCGWECQGSAPSSIWIWST